MAELCLVLNAARVAQIPTAFFHKNMYSNVCNFVITQNSLQVSEMIVKEFIYTGCIWYSIKIIEPFVAHLNCTSNTWTKNNKIEFSL